MKSSKTEVDVASDTDILIMWLPLMISIMMIIPLLVLLLLLLTTNVRNNCNNYHNNNVIITKNNNNNKNEKRLYIKMKKRKYIYVIGLILIR